MKHKLQTLMIALALTMGVGAFVAAPVSAINVFKSCPNGSDSSVCKAKGETVESPIQAVIRTLLIAIGIISVIMIIVGGLRYVLSNGDSSQISNAKNTILYAVIGLVVAMLAYAIVGFVVNQFK